MRIKIIPYLSFVIVSLGYLLPVAGQDPADQLALLFPEEGEVKGWSPVDSIEFAAGDDLYLLIDGGAEIYHEFGFLSAGYGGYKSEQNQTVNLEIYEMSDPGAAYGMFTFKTGSSGTDFRGGCQGWLESYYLNFWGENYLVTVVALDTGALGISGLQRISQAVSARIDCRNQQPEITGFLPPEGLQPAGIKYIRGNLGLFNQYLFDRRNIFGVKDGVIGIYSGFRLMIFQYYDKAESEKWYQTALAQIKTNMLFRNCRQKTAYFEADDLNANTVILEKTERWILAAVGKEFDKLQTGLEKIKSALKER
jgi:hypothetical protein